MPEENATAKFLLLKLEDIEVHLFNAMKLSSEKVVTRELGFALKEIEHTLEAVKNS